MIPRRVKLKGFLCYRDEQEVSFGGSSLWMLAGLNGSGKSTVFDALTFALFGHHRGGSQQVTELINKDSNGFAVEFDFTLDGKLYQIRRTVKRTPKSVSSTQQIHEWHPGPDGSGGDWRPLEGRHMRTAFDEWVREHIGLNYETFTSSVLLLQGRAEKLLDSSPKGRSEVLAGIVDLERYQRLHERADGQRKSFKGRLEGLQAQLAALPEVTELELALAAGGIEEAAEACRRAEAECDSLREREHLAARWADLGSRLQAAERRFTAARELRDQATEVERDHCRLRELREVLPHVLTIIQQRNRLRELEGESARLQADRKAAGERAAQRGRDLERARDARKQLERRQAETQQKAEAVSGRLRLLQGTLQQVKMLEQQQAEADRLKRDLAALPARPFDAVQRATQELEELNRLEQALPTLARFHAARADLASARNSAAEASRRETEIKAEGVRLKAEWEGLGKLADDAAAAARTADERVADARAHLQHARTALEEIGRLDGSTNCRACGQPLTPEHLHGEKARREKEAAAAELAHRQATAAQEKARRHVEGLRERHTRAGQQLTETRERYQSAVGDKKYGLAAVERLTRECGEAWATLPETLRGDRKPAADWPADAWPTESELAALRGRAAGVGSARRRLQEATTIQERFSFLTAQEQSVNNTLAALRRELPADANSIRRDHAAAQAEEGSLQNELKALRAELQKSQQDLDRLGREQEEALRQTVEFDGALKTREQVRILCRETIDRTRKLLPDAWRKPVDEAGMADNHRWQAELDSLRDRKTEERFAELQMARASLETLRQAVEELRLEASVFPPEGKADVAQVKQALAAALAAADAARKQLAAAERQRQALDERVRQRENLRGQVTAVEREHNYYSLLAQLLGRDRLQRHLVRQAERQIVDHANGVLDRLSSGQLSLRLVGTDDGTGADRALELEAFNRSTGGQPINVAFLSGSQRFRVAVSLALGIGQYANRRHRPIESVIIDEGFGCLDRQGRQVMIQELQNLRGHLHCILLVSHQEEFAEAFADGYQFELQEGTTRVTRVQR